MPQQNSTPAKTRLSLGCISLFLLPFFAVGLFALITGIGAMKHGQPNAMVPIAFGIVFMGVAAGVFWAISFGFRKAQQEALLREQNPGKPWLWKLDWQSGTITSQGSAQAIFMTVFAIIWNAITVPAVVMVLKKGVYKETPAVLFILIFPLIGVLILISAVYQLLRQRKYGQSRLMLPHVPVSIGTMFRGEIITRLQERPENGFVLTAASVRRVTSGTGKSRSTTESTLWSDQETVAGASAVQTMEGLRIPFSIGIPTDVRETDQSDSNDETVWRLDVKAEVPGIEYAARFDLPVFKTAETPHEVRRFQPSAMEAAAWTPTTASRIAMGQAADGSEEIRINSHARFGEFFAGFLFAAVWWTALWALVRFNVPIAVPIFMGLFGALLVIGLIDSLIGGSIIRVRRDVVVVKRHWFGVPIFSRTIDAMTIESVVANPAPNA